MEKGWLISLNALNAHHSLALHTTSRQVRNISGSLESLTNSISNIERSSIELTGTVNAILDLLKSGEHRESTIAAMRSLIFHHQTTCESAMKDDDSLVSYISCLVSEKLLNQPWFNLDLFSFVSFDEMKSASSGLQQCKDIAGDIESRLGEEEKEMVSVFLDSLEKMEEIEKERDEAISKFIWIYGRRKDRLFWGSFVLKSGGMWVEEITWHDDIETTLKIFSSKEKCADFDEKARWAKMIQSFSIVPRSKEIMITMSRKPVVKAGIFRKGWSRESHSRWKGALEDTLRIYRAFDECQSVFEREGEVRSIVESANESFKGRLWIEGDGVLTSPMVSPDGVDEVRKEEPQLVDLGSLIVYVDDTGPRHAMPVGNAKELRKILSYTEDFWIVELWQNPLEFVQWGRGSGETKFALDAQGQFEHWRDGEMLSSDEVISMEGAIRRLFKDFLAA